MIECKSKNIYPKYKPTFSEHINNINKKVNRKKNILGRLAGVEWGESVDLNKMCKSYIKPNLLCRSKEIFTVNNQLKDKLEIAQSKCLRVVTGVVKRTTATMHSITDISIET